MTAGSRAFIHVDRSALRTDAMIRLAIRIVCFSMPALAAFAPTVLVTSALAQAPAGPELRNPKLSIDYVEPRSAEFQDLYERLKKRQVLEELAQFLSPLKLPLSLRLKFAECGVVNADYDPLDLRIRICYEWVDFMEKRAPTAAVPAAGLVSRADAIVGSTVSVILHEMGHALFDILKVPVLGKEEDAADQIAGFIMLQFGKETARRLITGTAFMYFVQSKVDGNSNFSDTHGTDLQRFYNYLCIAYGREPETFADFVAKNILPTSRAENCAREYRQVQRAYMQLINPFVDQEMMKKVQAIDWLKPRDKR